ILRNGHRAVRGCDSGDMSCSRASSIRAVPNWPAPRGNTDSTIQWTSISSGSPGTAEALKNELATGKGDGEILAWIEATAPHKRTPWEIQQWSAYQNERGPDGDVETREFF